VRDAEGGGAGGGGGAADVRAGLLGDVEVDPHQNVLLRQEQDVHIYYYSTLCTVLVLLPSSSIDYGSIAVYFKGLRFFTSQVVHHHLEVCWIDQPTSLPSGL